MLTTLLFPPQWIPTQPYLSLPSLTAFLKANDCDVEQMDINVTFYDDLLSKKGLLPFFERAYSRFNELESKKELSPELQKQYAILGGSILAGEYVLENVESSKKVLRDKNKFYEYDELNDAFKILELGLKLASSAYYPTNLTFHAYDMRYSCRSSIDVLDAINDREENIFINYFENSMHKILKKRPELAGISIINTSQLIPGLTLANLIKKADKNVHINIGGSVFTRLINEISQNDRLFSIVDSIIVHEGETALLSLIKHLESGAGTESVPNLIYKKGTEIKVNKISSEGEDINSLPTPDFDGLPLELYLSPELVLPLLSSRGCYWKRCTFCDHGYGYSGKYRPRDVSRLYNDLEALKNKHRTGFFTFQDEGISPKLISAVSDKITENSLNISWLADSRFEPAFSEEVSKKMANAGCKMLYFGLESANERILECMDKGIKKENVMKICKYCADAGIWTHLFLIFGFPTETMGEAKETMDFVLQNSNVIRSLSFGSFQLTKHSRVHGKPDMFGVRRIMQSNELDFSLWYDYEVQRGMSKKEANVAIDMFDSLLSQRYRDFQLWRTLDREHLFLYISHYKKARRVPNLAEVIERASRKKKGTVTKSKEFYPVLNEGVFIGTFNFNWGKIMHALMKGDALNSSVQCERTHVIFDTNNNGIYAVTDFIKDLLEGSSGESRLSEIIGFLKGKYQMNYADAELKCRGILQELMNKGVIVAK